MTGYVLNRRLCGPIRGRLSIASHIAVQPSAVFEFLATDAGRARFWAESAVEADGWITWTWPGGMSARTRIIEAVPPHHYSVEYFGGSRATFELQDDGAGGTDLTLTDEGVRPEDWLETPRGLGLGCSWPSRLWLSTASISATTIRAERGRTATSTTDR